MKTPFSELLTSFLQEVISLFVCLLGRVVVEGAPRGSFCALSLPHLEISSHGNVWSYWPLFVLSHDAFDFLLHGAEVLLCIVFMTATMGQGRDRFCLVISERCGVKALVQL